MTSNHSWLDQAEFPFKNNYIELSNGKMHYIDEGEGDILLFVHGTPTWSFLYRDFIKEFSSTHRCIAIDHIGFGLSDKPSDFEGTPESHSNNLIEFVTKLNLKNINIIVHDFGGPIGLSAAIAENQRINKIVMFNTWLWETKSNKDVQKIDKIVNGFLGKLMYLNFNFSPKVLLKKGFHDSSKLSKKLHEQYIEPFPTKQSRLALLNIAKSLLGSSDWYQNQWDKLNKIDNKEWLIIWGTKDSFLSNNYKEKWYGRLPNAKRVELDCGHFIQEEKTKEAIEAIRNFL